MICLRLLGAVQIVRDNEPVPGFESRKALALLCYLAVRSQPVSRSHLAEMFWSGKTEAQGRANLSWCLHHILSRLPGCLKTDRHAVLFHPSLPASLDTTTFQALARQGDLESLVSCADLVRGEFMAEFDLDDAPEFEIWMHREREMWRQRIAQVLQTLITYHAAHHAYSGGVAYATRLLKLEPWREEAHRYLMLLLTRSGQRNAALAQYEACRRLLATELGVEPDPETTTLYEQIRDGVIKSAGVDLQPSAAAPSSNGAVSARRLTVMACEFVGLLALAETLSVDKFHDLVCACRQACAEVVHHYSGHVAQYRGSGLLVYFGFPCEDQAAPQRAIEAGLSLVRVVEGYSRRLEATAPWHQMMRTANGMFTSAASFPPADGPLTIRIGIHSGEVLDSGEASWFGPASLVGAPLILAERLQGIAAPNTVLINQATNALVEGRFDCEPVGTHPLEGFDSPQPLYQVLSVGRPDSVARERQRVLAFPSVPTRRGIPGLDPKQLPVV